MPENYYHNKLYPVQDKILDLIAELPVRFYLTGRTALSRAYLNHRFSDDLDFFVNADKEFKLQTESVLKTLNDRNIKFERGTVSDDFIRIFITNLDVPLKMDFVNDVAFRFKNPKKTKLFRHTDHPLNILINKICALSRLEAKDVIDILFISHHYTFNWVEIISNAQKKDVWVEPLEVSHLLNTFPVHLIDNLKMKDKVNNLQIQEELVLIAKDILSGSDNSRYV